MRITPIQIEWNSWNGFIFKIVGIDNGGRDRALFGINVSTNFLYVDILFFIIKVFDKTDYSDTEFKQRSQK